MYYDIMNECIISAKEMQQRGLPLDDIQELARIGFHELTIEQPEYDPSLEGLEPNGRPAPDPENPLAFIQRMNVYNLLDRHKQIKKQEVTNLRWIQETGGITLPNGVQILTGIDDQNRIASAIQGMQQAGLNEVDFKAASGWVKLTLEELQQIASLIVVHVQACFTQERAYHEAIDVCTSLEELNAIDLDVKWPNYEAPELEEPEEVEAA